MSRLAGGDPGCLTHQGWREGEGFYSKCSFLLSGCADLEADPYGTLAGGSMAS